MDSVYPVYSSLEECNEECGSVVSYCIGHMPNLVCQLNFVAFLAVIFLAIFTGIFIPISCLFCWISGGCRRSKNARRFSVFTTLSSRRRSRHGTGNEEERSSLYPSSPPTLQIPAQKCRQMSSFSLPAVSHDVILEESESSDHEWKKAKRTRKITFDLSMTHRDDFSNL